MEQLGTGLVPEETGGGGTARRNRPSGVKRGPGDGEAEAEQLSPRTQGSTDGDTIGPLTGPYPRAGLLQTRSLVMVPIKKECCSFGYQLGGFHCTVN